MIYLDYCATTPVDDSVLDSFVKTSKDFLGNPNSLHKLGSQANEIINEATLQIAHILKILPSEIIYTSGSSEANNTAIKGVAYTYKNRGNHIITTNFEHSSIYGPLNYLAREGYDIEFVETNEFGVVDINDLKKKLRHDTILVSIGAVNSEIGIIQPIDKIGDVLKNYPKCLFHVDMTQAIGKINVSLDNIDLASMSAHKIYGIKGIGILYKKENLKIEPLIHGGKSTTIYRSGTPATSLIVSLARALRLIMSNLDKNYTYVCELNKYLIDKLKSHSSIFINSNDKCLPNVVNISIPGIKPEVMLHALAEENIYISTQTACSTSDISKSVLALTHNEERARSSMRISLSHLTTYAEINTFIEVLFKKIDELRSNK